MAHELTLWADSRKVATLVYEPSDDRWVLEYAQAWTALSDSYPVSPALPFDAPAPGYAPGAVKRFVENLLPEGRALDISATTYNVSKTNIFGLIYALGIETSGAFRFLPADKSPEEPGKEVAMREVTLAELNTRLADRALVPFPVWDGKVRMSIAGYQDKLLVYLDGPLANGGRMYLAEPPLASTHILKPQPDRADMPHLVINEHFCMSLARRMGLPAAKVGILRAHVPVLVVTRFDREVIHLPDIVAVRRRHVIDACQACDLPVSMKYERNFGGGKDVQHIRDGVSFQMLFARSAQSISKVSTLQDMLRWALFQYIIGNSDAHGKNYSFFVHREGLAPTPWYDLVSVVQYPKVDHDLAMAFGDAFRLDEVKSFALADFAKRCGIRRSLLQREATLLNKLVHEHAPLQASCEDYLGDERQFAGELCDFVLAQSDRLAAIAKDAVEFKDELL